MKSQLFSAIAGGAIKDGVILGVSVITIGEAKGHGVYIDQKSLESYLSAAINRQGGVPVKMDHGTGFYHIVGKLENFRVDGDSLRADLHLLKSHEQFERIVEMAETMADSFGLSVSSVANSEKIDGKEYLRCEELNSVDLVDRPAANPNGLFRESVDSRAKDIMADANTLLSRIRSVFVETENADLVSAKTELTTTAAKVTELSAKITALEASVSTKDEEIKTLKAAQGEFDKKVDLAASAKADQILAAVGQTKPIPSTPAASPAAAPKADLSKLPPRERVIAAFTAQTAAKATANLVTK